MLHKSLYAVLFLIAINVSAQDKLYGNTFNLSDVQLLPGVLMIRYWGNEQGKRSFKIYMDDALIATENIAGKWTRNEFVDVEYALPESIFKNKSQVQLKIVPEYANYAGCFYYIALLKY